MKKYLILLAISLVGFQSWATITYKLKYNAVSDVFEVYLVSTASSAGNVGGSQATIAFDPAFDVNAITTTSFLGAVWNPQDKVTGNTGSLNGKKVVAFSTNGANIGAITANTEYKLFQFTFGAGTNCGVKTLRLFVNASDPGDPNGSGGDFASFMNLNGVDLFSTNSDATFKTCALLTVLPVRFSQFTVVKKDKDGLLSWITENQDGMTSHFEIERSMNGVDFTFLGRIDAIPAVNGSANYNYPDKNVGSLRFSGPVYYRIKQIDKDGRFVYTEIRSIRFDSKIGIAIYPNPAKTVSSLTVDLPEDALISVRISDVSGKELQKYEINGTQGTNLKRIDLSKFAAGTYIVRVKTGEMMQIISLIKSE